MFTPPSSVSDSSSQKGSTTKDSESSSGYAGSVSSSYTSAISGTNDAPSVISSSYSSFASTSSSQPSSGSSVRSSGYEGDQPMSAHEATPTSNRVRRPITNLNLQRGTRLALPLGHGMRPVSFSSSSSSSAESNAALNQPSTAPLPVLAPTVLPVPAPIVLPVPAPSTQIVSGTAAVPASSSDVSSQERGGAADEIPAQTPERTDPGNELVPRTDTGDETAGLANAGDRGAPSLGVGGMSGLYGDGHEECKRARSRQKGRA